ncbi:MAG: hypothetical protein KDH09_03545, partial [Chrysiogenetes bacterium]|nr:hypothetical protein [Chrysiogenetes bacterium]
FDEFGLYLVHHNRWVVSAADNNAGERLGREYSVLTGKRLGKRLGARFAQRQVRRLPYLFSVAPAGYRRPGLGADLTPPAREGFPPTHGLLDEACALWLEAVEAVLHRQPYLLGEQFTLADASVYGEIMMNLSDPSAERLIQARAPCAWDWCRAIAAGAHRGQRGGELSLNENLAPLMEITAKTYGALMQQNEAAWKEATAKGETLFNERAFNRGRALYEGELLGRSFRHVVKTFQVRSWQDLRARWNALTDAQRAQVESLYPIGGLF